MDAGVCCHDRADGDHCFSSGRVRPVSALYLCRRGAMAAGWSVYCRHRTVNSATERAPPTAVGGRENRRRLYGKLVRKKERS